MKYENFEGQGSLFEYMSGSNAVAVEEEKLEEPIPVTFTEVTSDSGYTTMEEELSTTVGTFFAPTVVGKINVPELSDKIKVMTEMLRPIIKTETKAKIEALLGSSEKREEALKGLKSDRAYINKLIDGVKDKNSKVRQQVMAPYDAFKEASKDLADLLGEAKSLFDEQVKRIEQAEKDEKLSAIRSYYNEKALEVKDLEGEYREAFFEKIFDKTWLNTTTSAKKYKEAIDNAIKNFVNGMSMLAITQSNFQKEGIEVFKATLDIGEASRKMQELQAQAELILQREREKAEAEKQRALEEAEAKAKRDLEAALERERKKAEEEMEKALAEEKRKASEAQAKARQAMNAPGVTIPGVTPPVTPIGYVPPVPNMANTNADEVVVSFSKTQWKMVQMFCQSSGINYTVK